MLDLRSVQSPIRDQGRRGTCVAFAATAGHEMLRAEGMDLSEEYLHWAAKKRDGLSLGEGTTLAAASAALGSLGQPPEDIWPYDENRDPKDKSYIPPSDAHRTAAERRLGAGRRLEPNAAALRDALDEGLAVFVGVRLFDTWYYPSPSGHVATPSAGSPPLGGHAILVVGYLNSKEIGEDCFIVRNSWGVEWGAEGYAFLPFGYVDSHGLQAWGLERPVKTDGGRVG